jgi:hypothetical protein
MAARANPFFESDAPEKAPVAEPDNALARLARLHVEAVETARLANLLGRSLNATITLGALAVLAVAAGGATWSPALAWAALVGVAVLAMMRSYIHAIHQPFERAALHGFAEDLRASLLYAGYAWGAGAFLVLSESNAAITVLLFATAPSIAIAALLRERQATALFLAPAATLSSLACVMRSFTGGAPAAAFILFVCAAAAFAIQAPLRARKSASDARFQGGIFA